MPRPEQTIIIGTRGSELALRQTQIVVTQLQAVARLTELYDEAAAAANRDEVGETLWEMLDVANDPGGFYDICMYQTAAVSSPNTATVNFQIQFSID